jgi:hypothetical protein
MLLRVFAAGCIAIAVQMTLGILLLGLAPAPDWIARTAGPDIRLSSF